RQLMPALQSTWLAIHVTLAALGSGAFLIAFAASSLFLISAAEGEKSASPETRKRRTEFYLLAWMGIPITVALLLRLFGLLPVEASSAAAARFQGLAGSAFTSFTLGDHASPLLLGRWAIGLGIGMLVGAVAWPFLLRRWTPKRGESRGGARMFIVVVLALLLSAIFTGYLVRSDIIHLTPQSYFKVFEFFGPTLVFSWILVPPLRGLLREDAPWVARLDVARPMLEEIGYSAVAIGYPLYTVGALFAGAIWAEQAWGSWWGWDPKEVGALIIWLFYTGYLHARYQRQWKGERAAILVTLGMVMVFLSFFGNYFFGGLHSFEVG
ncbi:MAG TPA: hypothetical protein ENI92_00950, partial [Bacteroidetes bacterium]|nr:hypothetical protein [Bacteroidota bacterium]